jgi:hypothetical protein
MDTLSWLRLLVSEQLVQRLKRHTFFLSVQPIFNDGTIFVDEDGVWSSVLHPPDSNVCIDLSSVSAYIDGDRLVRSDVLSIVRLVHLLFYSYDQPELVSNAWLSINYSVDVTLIHIVPILNLQLSMYTRHRAVRVSALDRSAFPNRVVRFVYVE